MQQATLQPAPPPVPPAPMEEDERWRRQLERRSPAFEPRIRAGPGTRDAAVQVELLREMPKEVYTTLHSTRNCSTLCKSTKYIKKDVCQRCIPGQRETADRPLG